MEKQRRGKGLLKIIFAILGVISGVSIFLSFIALKNVNAAIWGLLSALFAAVVLSLHLAHRRNTLIERFPLATIRRLRHFGAFGSFATIIAAITYFTLAGVLKQGYKLENDGYMPAGIFALLTLKWTAFLFCYSKRYKEMYSNCGETKPIANGDHDEHPKDYRN